MEAGRLVNYRKLQRETARLARKQTERMRLIDRWTRHKRKSDQYDDSDDR